MTVSRAASGVDVLAALDDDQRAAVTAMPGPVGILAGPGTGKTRTIAHRIAHAVQSGQWRPQQVLAVTFTNRAAAELRHRLRMLGVDDVSTGTFHAVALRQLRYFWPRLVGGAFPRIVADKTPFLTQAAGQLGVRLSDFDVRDVAADVEWAKVLQCPPQNYPALARRHGRVSAKPADETAALYDRYEALKSAAHCVDFEDVLLLLVALLETEPEAVRMVRGRYQCFVVDEYQDVNALEQRLLDAWLGPRTEVCVVGDPRQAIYGFAGATDRYLVEFAERYPQATMVSLTRNYRSTQEILAAAHRLVGGTPLIAVRGSGVPPTVVAYPTVEAEAQGVAASVAELISSGVSPDDIAVLVRRHVLAEPISAAFDEVGIRSVRTATASRTGVPRTAGAVTIASLHAAKGLEWEAVFLPGWADGILPDARALSVDAVAEERRLAYVGVTRARRVLVVSYPRSVQRAGERVECEPSRFLAAFAASARPAVGEPSVEPAEKPGGCGAAGGVGAAGPAS